MKLSEALLKAKIINAEEPEEVETILTNLEPGGTYAAIIPNKFFEALKPESLEAFQEEAKRIGVKILIFPEGTKLVKLKSAEQTEKKSEGEEPDYTFWILKGGAWIEVSPEEWNPHRFQSRGGLHYSQKDGSVGCILPKGKTLPNPSTIDSPEEEG